MYLPLMQNGDEPNSLDYRLFCSLADFFIIENCARQQEERMGWELDLHNAQPKPNYKICPLEYFLLLYNRLRAMKAYRNIYKIRSKSRMIGQWSTNGGQLSDDVIWQDGPCKKRGTRARKWDTVKNIMRCSWDKISWMSLINWSWKWRLIKKIIPTKYVNIMTDDYV